MRPIFYVLYITPIVNYVIVSLFWFLQMSVLVHICVGALKPYRKGMKLVGQYMSATLRYNLSDNFILDHMVKIYIYIIEPINSDKDAALTELLILSSIKN